VKLDRCPKAYVTDQPLDLLAAIRDVQRYHQRGVLPDSGGWLDQHPHWTEAELIVTQASEGVTSGKEGNPKR